MQVNYVHKQYKTVIKHSKCIRPKTCNCYW